MTSIIHNNTQINITGKMIFRTQLPEEELRIYVQKTIAKKFNVDWSYISVDLYHEEPETVMLLNSKQYAAHYTVIYSTNSIS